jgi:hypothetical protein
VKRLLSIIFLGALFLSFAIIPWVLPSFGFRLPSAGDDEETLRDFMNKPLESDIESDRTYLKPGEKKKLRPASEDKGPFKADDLFDLEEIVWPHFDLSPWNFREWHPSLEFPNSPIAYGSPGRVIQGRLPEDAVDSEGRGWYLTGCIIDCPEIRYDCNLPYT